MTRTAYETAVARFRTVPGGRVAEEDYFVPGRPPYRHGRLRVVCNRAAVPGLASQIAQLTAEVDGHMTLFCATDVEFWFDVSASRDLEPDEIGDDPRVVAG